MNIKKRIVMSAIILIAVGLIGSIATFNAQGEASQINDTKTINNGSFENVVIRANNAKIEILPARDTEARAELSGHGVKETISFDLDINDATLEVTMKERQRKFFNFDFNRSALQLKVYLPVKQYDTITVDAANGEIRASELQSSQMFTDLVNGETRLNNISVSEGVTADSQNGKIFMENIEGTITADLVNGDIYLTLSHIDRNIDLEVVNGKINIESQTEPANAIISAKVVNGKAEIFGNSGKDLVIGSGENKVNLETINGEIIVK